MSSEAPRGVWSAPQLRSLSTGRAAAGGDFTAATENGHVVCGFWVNNTGEGTTYNISDFQFRKGPGGDPIASPS